VKIVEENDNAEKGWSTQSGISDGIPVRLPTLAKAQAISERAAIIGFDFSNIDGVLEKLAEESKELRLAIKSGRKEKIVEEAGDLLFTIVNLCRFTGIDAEEALNFSLKKFIDRFTYVERKLAAIGKIPENSAIAEMDHFWEEAKKQEGFFSKK
jgi:tetrapyrrole methylase family protein / MazG family protein